MNNPPKTLSYPVSMNILEMVLGWLFGKLGDMEDEFGLKKRKRLGCDELKLIEMHGIDWILIVNEWWILLIERLKTQKLDFHERYLIKGQFLSKRLTNNLQWNYEGQFQQKLFLK